MRLPSWIQRDEGLAPFEPCPQCSRHVKSNATTCPFCGAATQWQPYPRLITQRPLSRSAMWALSAAVGMKVLSACGEPRSESIYGAPCYDACVFDSAPADAGIEHLITFPDADETDADANTADGDSTDADAADAATTITDASSDQTTPSDADPDSADAQLDSGG